MITYASSPRILAAAGGMSLASLLALAGAVSAVPMPNVTYSASGDVLKTSVTGDARTGMWRIRLVAPDGTRRIDFILRSGDVAWSGQIQVSRRQGNSWSLVSKRSLDDALAGGPILAGCNAGVCWDTSLIRTPRNGDARFGLTVRLAQAGTYRVSGGVRQAVEAFVYGSWLTSSSQAIVH